MTITRFLLPLLFMCVFSAIIITTSSADEITGQISVLDAEDETIVISGVKILTAGASIENESGQPIKLRDLEAGKWVQIKGSLSGPGEMTATQIVNKTSEFDSISGTIEKSDLQGVLTISGVTILVPISAVLEGEGGKKLPFNMFIPGISVKCTGEWTGMKELTATKVKVRY